MTLLGRIKHATYMIPSSAPTAKHCNAITSQKNSGLSYLETITPTPICIRIVRRPLNNFNAIKANATITTNTINITGIGAVARL
jgi:hypothetical protein